MRNRRVLAYFGLAILAVVSVFYLYAQYAVPPPQFSAPAAQTSERATAFSAERYMADVTYLARDEMKGRGDGSPELDLAAEYIAEQFRRAGLKPAGEGGTYFQNFDITTGAGLGPNNAFQIAGAALKLNDDFIPVALSSSAEFEGPVAFAGFGITAAEYNYDDYADIDVNGKIVVVFEYEPQENEPSSPFAGTGLTPYASFTNKAINARMHGAKAIVFIAGPNREAEDFGAARHTEEESDMGIPAVHARRAPVIAAFKNAGKDLAAIQTAIDKDLKPQSFDVPGVTARIAADIVRTRKPVKNVLAAVEGSDPALKDQWVIVGAHYDHLGLGNRNSLAPSQVGQIHHGADDNASGTAGIMELARLAAGRQSPPKRSVLFMAFAGEEIGLLGSSHFANNPTVPIASIDAMINLDMIGRIRDDRIFVGGTGTSPSFKTILEEVNASTNAVLQETDTSVGLMLNFSESGYGASDHTSFNAKKIPVLFFFSGLHTDYHKPSDTYDKINAAGAGKVVALVDGAVGRIADAGEKLAYVEVREPTQVRRGGGGGYGPYFGSVPDFRDDLKGVLFSDVVTDSPAAKAGLKAGDLMTQFDGKQILGLQDYAFALRTKRPGDVVAVVVKRGNEDVKVSVTLGTRR